MAQRFRDLKAVLNRLYPEVDAIGEDVDSAYDARVIQRKCFALLQAHPEDQWSLNATGGTKLMSAPAIEVFRQRGLQEVMPLDIYYVETPENAILKVSDEDWAVTKLPFEGQIGVEDYFALYGREVVVGQPRTPQEALLVWHLEQLEWQVWPSVQLKAERTSATDDRDLAEYDAIAIDRYKLYAFECKQMTGGKYWEEDEDDPQRQVNRLISQDTYKLFQVRQGFGGPFGSSFWVFDGKAEIRAASKERLRVFSVGFINGQEIEKISSDPASLKLPKRKASAAGHPPTKAELRRRCGLGRAAAAASDLTPAATPTRIVSAPASQPGAESPVLNASDASVKIIKLKKPTSPNS